MTIKRIICLAFAAMLALGIPGAAGEDAEEKEYFTKRDLSGTWKEKDEVRLELTESITLTEDAVYILSGTITDGTVTVDAGKNTKVQLVLDNVDITSSSSAAILVESADKVFITLAEGSENTLTCTGFDDPDGADGAVYSRDDITFNGSGKLTIHSAHHGIVGKDDVKITGGEYEITAESRGITANDSVRIADGKITVVSEKDAIRVRNTENTEKGYLLIAGGELNLAAGGGSKNGKAHTEDFGPGRGGNQSQEDSDSAKGLKATNWLMIQDGTVTIDAADDAVHSDTTVTVSGGTLHLSTGDDGIHANETLTIGGGTVEIEKSYEGLEATAVVINDGDIRLKAEDDGINCAGGNDGSGWGRYDMFASDGSSITINGGELRINATGDGMDSNGDLTVNGGKIVVSGPISAYNGALDANGTMAVHGGTVIAAGAKGMAATFGDTSTQVSFMIDLKGDAGSEITVRDEAGEILLSATVEKRFSSLVISSPELEIGKTYTVSSGSEEETVTITEISSGNGEEWGGSNGGPGRR